MRKQLLTYIFIILSFTCTVAQHRPYKLNSSIKKEDIVPGRIVVKYKPEAVILNAGKEITLPLSLKKKLKSLGAEKTRQMFNWPLPAKINKENKLQVKSLEKLSLIHTIQFDASIDVEAAINMLLADPSIEYAEPLLNRAEPLFLPNDPFSTPSTDDPYAIPAFNFTHFDRQQYYLSTIKAYEAWDVQKGDPEVTIGIIDFGIQVNHEDLKDNIQYNYNEIPDNGIDDDQDGYVDNFAGWNAVWNNGNLQQADHGTRVAGVAAGTPNNGKGIAGVGYNCKFIPITAYDKNSLRFYGWPGVEYAIKKGCKVVNLSYKTGSIYLQWEQDLVDIVVFGYDVVVVVAAGNTHADAHFYPASYNNLLSVAGTDAYDQKWSGSTYNKNVDISAPGYFIQSTIDNSALWSGYAADHGTSYAAPIVSGTAALVRSQFPSLKATEVMQRLKATADTIYHIPANAPYQGKLGSGRVNVFRAVSEVLRMQSNTIAGFNNQPYIWPSHPTIFSMHFFNPFETDYLDAQVTLSTTSPFVEILSSTSSLGSISSFGSANNATDPFKIVVKPGTPRNTVVTFKLTYSGTFASGNHAFSGFETFSQVINPDYLNIDVNQLQLTATSKGRVGYNGNLKEEGGIGVNYNNLSLLADAGLMLGISPTHVSDCVRGTTLPDKQESFTSVQGIWFNSSNGADLSAGGIFTDTINNPNKIGLHVSHQAYAWKDSPDNKYVIVEYKITNTSGADLPKLYAALFADWDIQGNSANKAEWDSNTRLGYVFNQSKKNVYAGIQLLTDQHVAYYVFDKESDINIYDGLSTEEKFQAISNGISRTTSTDGTLDLANVLGAEIDNLKNGETKVVAFAFLAGDNLNELKTIATAAREKFIQIKTSPLPYISALDICKGNEIQVNPANGKKFNLYTSLPLTSPIASGNSFTIGKAITDTTFYVTGIDFILESEPVKVIINVENIQADFTIQKDTIDLSKGEILKVTNLSTNALQWQWDFGDEQKDTKQNATHLYTEIGEYQVKLTATNRLGCQDIMTRKVVVVRTIETIDQLAKIMRITPNPTDDEVKLEVENYYQFNNMNISIFNSLGQEIITHKAKDNLCIISLKHQRKGFYYVKINIDNKIIVEKIRLK